MRKSYILTFIALFFAFVAFSQMTILVVNDNGWNPERVQPLKLALDNGGYTYDTINTTSNGGSPTFAEMGGYDVVIWYTGNDGAGLSLWNGSDTDNQHIKDYIDNGGMFWLQGLDWLYDRYGGAPDSFVAGDFVYDYLGIAEYVGQSHLDDGVFADGVPQFDLVAGNGIFTLDPMLWSYATMWYADAMESTPTASDLYMMGPAGYDLDAYAGSIYNEKVNGAFTGRVISIATETARFDSQASLDQYFDEGLTYFDQFVIVNIPVTDIDVYGEGNATSIAADGGTLQFYADVLPANATNQTVAWSIVEETATASIDNAGLLTATGTPAGNGTLWVKASAVDGSGIADSVQITISNQGTSANFHVLLVNDNGYDATRYLEVDTALNNSGYNHDIYNTIVTGDFPDNTTLNLYDAVIWYTGNDGAGLYLWDLSDPNDYKFNAPLIDYIDNGGLLWVQGLDFLYDVYGGAPDVFTEGLFTYDYLGIQEYHAQSWADDGNTGVEQIEVVADNGIFSITPIQWVYTELHYADALIETPNAYPLYTMGPTGYTFEGYACSIYKMINSGMVMLSAIETARIDTQDNTDTYIDEGLSIMEDYAAGNILVNDIEVTGEGGETTIDIDGGDLQMLAEVFPHFANNQSITWSVIDGTATATIDANGVLEGTGTPAGNGTVYAKATANDGSGVSDSVMVTISMQATGENFNVLLVVDDNTGDRYLEIDTALMNGGYNYDIYFSLETSDIPSYTQLNNYQAVIWYTANDGVNLNLWDTSDPEDYKFNEPLIQYIDNGGIVWLQGLDYFYDVYGQAPDSFEEGSFVYDYMGVQEYHAQSWSDDENTGVVQVDTVGGNGIFTVDPINWVYTELHFADALAITPEAQPVYKMGPDDYVFSDYYCGLYKYHENGGMLMSFTIEPARMATQEMTDQFIDEGLSFFDFYLENGILVTDIEVYTEGDINTIDEDAGYLQMYANVFPVFAPNQSVVWSVVDGTATATITEDGLLIATGSPSNGNGTVYAKATAADGSEVADSLMITISNQTLPEVPVSEINVSGTDGVTLIDTDGGSLQMLAEVLPVDATQDSVLWSVVPGTTNASIDAFGLLTANGEDDGNGTVYAKATAYDGSGVVDSIMITISNQESDIVLVEEINVSGDGGATTIELDGGSLQMLAEVLPVNVDEDSVLWSVVPVTTNAIIDANGLLTANGEDDGNGTVYAKATAFDGSGTMDSILITISNQISDPILVESIEVSGEGGAMSISEDGGSLQMMAEVLPENASQDSVLWSVVEGTTTASINAFGLLTATGEDDGNGTVWAKATAYDGSGIADSLEITISNQTSGGANATILLVNDNANGTDRYLVIDTTLNNLGYEYEIFNTVTEGDIPDLAYLETFELVIWYTGNDGVDLYLWDVSNPDDYQFNPPLKDYIDNGGVVWVQGLDFLYDIVGSAPVSFNDGQFIYDYMGIAEYVAQSHVDDIVYDGVPQLDVIPDNGICTISPIEWTYSTMWYVDAIDISDGANGIYKMGPVDYDFSDYYAMFYRVVPPGKVITSTFETARINTRENTETFFWEVIENIDQMVGIDKPVSSEFMVYPNPANDYIHFRLEHSQDQNLYIELYNIKGQLILNSELHLNQNGEAVLNTADIQSGIYFYQMISEENIFAGKIIINK